MRFDTIGKPKFLLNLLVEAPAWTKLIFNPSFSNHIFLLQLIFWLSPLIISGRSFASSYKRKKLHSTGDSFGPNYTYEFFTNLSFQNYL